MPAAEARAESRAQQHANLNRNHASMPPQLRNLVEKVLRERGEVEWNELPPISLHESELKDEFTRTLFG